MVVVQPPPLTTKLLAAWAYDTLDDNTVVKGYPASTTRYVGGASGSAYKKRVDGYNTAYQPASAAFLKGGRRTSGVVGGAVAGGVPIPTGWHGS